jgi:hypothetical protein
VLAADRGDATVDNFHFGGMIAPVDLATGRLGSGLRREGRLLAEIAHHPDTGVAIEDHQLPLWDAVTSLVRRAHDAARGMPAIGWDVAINLAARCWSRATSRSTSTDCKRPAGRRSAVRHW